MSNPRDVGGTRRDDPFVAPGETRRDGAIPGQTRRDAPAGSDGPAATRRDAPTPDGTGSRMSFPPLPADVAVRYRPARMLARQGAEGDVYLVTDPAGDEWVLKVYRRDIVPDARVWATLSGTASKHLVSVHETGTALDGRKYEVMEYLPDGDLRTIASRGVLDPAMMRTIIAQLADGLVVLHAAQIIHRDLKPENVLVRCSSPLELVLTDFGLARALDQSSAFSTAARTLLYTAPETFAGHISSARDWWSLGMIIRELATGERPFEGWSEEVIVSHLISRPIDLSHVADPRIALLCSGLLVRDPHDRWRAEQVRDWLAGGTPPVAADTTASSVDAVPAFTFLGTGYRDPHTLAAAVADRWDDAARTFFALSTSERWKALKGWLAHFDDSPFYEGEARQRLCDELDASNWPPDVKLLRLLVLLDPRRDPAYRGVLLRPEDLPGVAAEAANGDAATVAVVEDLWREGVLTVLARRPEDSELAWIDARWRAGYAAFERVAGEVVSGLPDLNGPLTDPVNRRCVLASTLSIAAVGEQAARAVDENLDRIAAGLPRRIDWFDRLLASRQGDPARSLAVLCTAAAATAQAQQIVMAEEQQRAVEAARQQEWRGIESARAAGQGAAVGYALGGAAVVLGLWFVFLFAGGASAAGLAIAALIVQTGIEVALACVLGGDYHPRFSLLRGTGRAAGEVGDFLRYRRGIGCVGIIALLIFIPILTRALPWMVPLLVVVGHGAWALARWNGWRRQHEEHRMAVLGSPGRTGGR